MSTTKIPFDSTSEFLKFWKDYAKTIIKCGIDSDFGFAHPNDFDEITKLYNSGKIIKINDWQEYLCHDSFLSSHFSNKCPHEKYLHIGLPLTPYTGNLKTAKLVLLLMNPGVAPSNYFMLNSNNCDLKKSLSHILNPHYMNSERAWSSGYGYGIKRWKKVLDELYKKTENMSLALKTLREGVAVLQYSPYPSKTGDWSILNKLQTSEYSKLAAQILMDEKKVVVCGRGADHWSLNSKHKDWEDKYGSQNPRNPQFKQPEKIAALLLG